MSSNTKSELFFLKQFGFSDRLLEDIYLFDESPLTIFFSDEKCININLKFTNKDRVLSKCFEQYSKFKFTLFENEEFLHKNGINRIYFKYDKTELSNLIPLKKMPLFMYSIGDYSLLNKKIKKVAIIGTRKPKNKSIIITKNIVKKYVEDDYIIVSGLAEGIDTIAHETVIKHFGRTIAVLPTNFKKIYPKENNSLAQDILKNGLLVSAIGPNEHTYKSSFLDRNLYVANISDIIIVIETHIKSGTMNTIRNASEAGKKILYLNQRDSLVNDKIKNYGGIMIDGNE